MWKEPASGETVRSFTIITCPPNALCAAVHDRMPVILGADDHPAWLGEAPASGEQLRDLLRPFPIERMTAHPIVRASATSRTTTRADRAGRHGIDRGRRRANLAGAPARLPGSDGGNRPRVLREPAARE